MPKCCASDGHGGGLLQAGISARRQELLQGLRRVPLSGEMHRRATVGPLRVGVAAQREELPQRVACLVECCPVQRQRPVLVLER